MVEIDDRDREIAAQRITALDEDAGPRVGDFVDFTDGVQRQISYLWPKGAQTSDGGSFYLGDGFVSFSGSLYPGVPRDALVLTPETRDGRVWIFHHGIPRAHSAVHFTCKFRVYTCNREAPR